MNNCKDCKHTEHNAGLCEKCNCGESEIINSKRKMSYSRLISKVGNAFLTIKIDCGGRVGLPRNPENG